MIAIPAWVWRFPLALRALILGIAAGIVVGLLAFLGSNSLLSGVAALVATALMYGSLMARRMARLWPGAKTLGGADRVAVVTAARAGDDVADPRLAQGVTDYARALHDAREHVRLYRWVVALLGAAALAIAIMDTVIGPVGEAVVSWLYFAVFPAEMIWWPRRQAELLANADRASGMARQLLEQQL